MKKFILSSVLLAASYGFAAEPAPAPAPSLEGTWELTSRACTSNAEIKDGLKLGQDSIIVSNNPDGSFQYKLNMAGCETVIQGTYTAEGMKVTYKATSSQSCKDANPVPLSESHPAFFAYLSDKEAVTVLTGDSAAMSCPKGDALIMHFNRQQPKP
ncbi:MAG: lipocalin family protein [Pseudobdellovibrionaceae bacterium]